jgi:hypothetical protein
LIYIQSVSFCCIVCIGILVHRRCCGAITVGASAIIVIVIIVTSRIRFTGNTGELLQIRLNLGHKLAKLQLGQSLNHILFDKKILKTFENIF